VHIGELPNKELVAKKTYSLYSNENLSSIENEIKILTVLSNRATPENSFIKFYGAEREKVNDTETNISLYMEAHSYSLIDKITELKKRGEFIPKDTTESVFAKLVLSFAEMQSLGIFHRDIKPHNILVTNDWNVKIIDFSVSDTLKHDDCYTTMTGQSLIQGTHGYMAPEVEEIFTKQEKVGFFRPGRADVFSLGLTIFQMISLKDTHALNFKCHDQYDRIKGLVRGLNAEEWVKILLTEMLNPDYRKRFSFKKCLGKFPKSGEEAYKTVRN
jgi:serine/threonine protein kinase